MVKQVALAVGIAIIAVASVAVAQQYVITPIEGNREARDLERRVWQLERAVQELQTKIYNLQTAQQNEGSPTRRYFCHVTAFGKEYKGYAGTQTEGKDKASSACMKDYSATFCNDVQCEENR